MKLIQKNKDEKCEQCGELIVGNLYYDENFDVYCCEGCANEIKNQKTEWHQ